MSLARIYATALNTFRETFRDKVLLAVIGFAGLLLLFNLVLAELSLHEQARTTEDIGVAIISLVTVLLCIILGASLLYKEIERKTVYLILPKPVSRAEFLLGKFLGIVMTAWTAILGMCAFHAISRWVYPGVPMVVTATAFVLVGFEACLVSACAMLFSSFSTPFFSGLLTLGVWLLGRSADTMATIQTKMLSAPIKAFLHALAWVVPNFHLFVPGRGRITVLADRYADVLGYVAQSALYAAVYSTVVLTCAVLLFKRRDFA